MHGHHITTVMYHYVRPLNKELFPNLKAINLQEFEAQIDYLMANYAIISPNELRIILKSGERPKNRTCVLTFDDGYADHFKYVFPVLATRNLKGFFFTPKSSLVDRKILNVNKIQFILASGSDPIQLKLIVNKKLQDLNFNNIQKLEKYFYKKTRYDSAQVSYVKALLQHALPESVRRTIIDQLFAQFVTQDLDSFCEKLYLSLEQAKLMADYGMEFGGHGDLHLWHDKCTDQELEREIKSSCEVVKSIHGTSKNSFYCYPFGGYNQRTLDCVKASGFMGGFTAKPKLTDLNNNKIFELDRMDTNDFPTKF